MADTQISQTALFALVTNAAVSASITQAAIMGLMSPNAVPNNISQSAAFVLSGPPNTPVVVSQTALFALLADARGIVTLRNVIPLNCWQPCTSYGTYSQVFIIG